MRASGPMPDQHPDLGTARRRDDVHRARGALPADLAPGSPAGQGRSPRVGLRLVELHRRPRSAACRRRRCPSVRPAGRRRASARKPSAVATNSRRAPTGMSGTSIGACPDRSEHLGVRRDVVDDERRLAGRGRPAADGAAAEAPTSRACDPPSLPGRSCHTARPPGPRGRGRARRRAPSRASS